MKLNGPTPLAGASAIPEDLRMKLRELWVDSVEEYVALTAAVNGSTISASFGLPPDAVAQSYSSASTLIGTPKSETLARARPGGSLGCLLDEQVLEAFQEHRHVCPGRQPVAAMPDSWKDLPASVRLADKLYPVRDQGERGTCVAFASVALREFIAGRKAELSEQFLYWACKELDGILAPGTYIRTAMSALSGYGVCLRHTFPYSTHQLPDSEAQAAPSDEARKQASEFAMRQTRTVEPSLVEHYKYVLAGGKDGEGMPVVVSTLVFNSWYMSSETHRTGKITLPLPGEQPLPGGHAWCVVGYVDDGSVPGGGYFVVRNSWGAGWAKDSPEAVGHALMPYEYVERYAVEAFTGELSTGLHQEENDADGFDAQYLHKLPAEERDIEGRLLPAGSRVIANPAARHEFMEDTPANRQQFLDTQFAWTPATRAVTWFPAVEQQAKAFREQISKAQTARQNFMAAIAENVEASTGKPFPRIQVPFFVALLPWQHRIKSVKMISDATEALVAEILRETGTPADIPIPDEWQALLSSINALKLYRVSSPHVDFTLAAAFVSPLELGVGRQPALVAAGPGTVDAVRRVALARAQACADEDMSLPFVTIGTNLQWPAELNLPTDGVSCILLSAPGQNGEWETSVPPVFATKPSFRDFLDRLKPETRQQRISKIKHTVDAILDTAYQGNLTVEKVAKETGYRRTQVRNAFLALQSSGHYRIYRRKPDGQVSIREAKPGEPVSLAASAFRPSILKRHCFRFIGAAAGVSGWVLRDQFAVGGAGGFVLLVFLVYTTSLIQTEINRRAAEEKE